MIAPVGLDLACIVIKKFVRPEIHPYIANRKVFVRRHVRIANLAQSLPPYDYSFITGTL
jgi:hypothetical protein